MGMRVISGRCQDQPFPSISGLVVEYIGFDSRLGHVGGVPVVYWRCTGGTLAVYRLDVLSGVVRVSQELSGIARVRISVQITYATRA